MDAIAAMLDSHRARRPFLLRCVLAPPWAIGIEDRAQLTLIGVTAGEVWVVHEGTPPVRLGCGDLALIRGPRPYRLADRPDRRPDVVIEPGQVCRLPDGETVGFSQEIGVRSWGNSADGSTVMLTAVYELGSQIAGSVIDRLPELTHLSGLAGLPVTALLTDELACDAVGQDVIVDRLADLLLVSALRAWFADPSHAAPAGWRAHDDPTIGRALQLMHEQPSEPWTVTTLAAEVNVSRATLARRFTALVGESPITYLTRWRINRGADLLTERGSTVAVAAAAVGYATPFAFSTAFKRELGVSPAGYRTSHRLVA